MRRRALRFIAVVVAAGVAATVALAWASALLVDLTGPRTATGELTSGEVRWMVDVTRAALGTRVTSHRQRGLSWSATQATGKPDTPQMGDIATAWASATPDGGAEWIELEYDPPVTPIAIHIYESCNPGAIVKATTCGADGAPPVVVWSGSVGSATLSPTGNPTTLAGTLTVPVRVLKIGVDNVRTPVRRVRLDLDSAAVAGWNEIDAVGLEDASGRVQWAKRARASSTYGVGTTTPPLDSVTPILPQWSGLVDPTPAFRDGETKSESRIVEGRGWPMPALMADVSTTGPALPVRPIPSGFAVDVVVLTAMASLIWWLMTWPKRFVTESLRMRRGHCMRCGYDLRYDFVAGCPECGWRRQ
jgi:hypothetical protein